jgi:perosamine synthetase
MDTMGLSPSALRVWFENNTEQQTQNNKQQTINKSTNRRISAVVPMHTFGHPCRIDEIVEICNEYNIPVVEDAAESLGSFYKAKHTGTFGKIGVLSFNGNKIITTGGGGMLLFDDEQLAKRSKHLTTQAKVPHPWEFMHDEIGYNYRMPNVNAALGLAQLEQLPHFLESKRKIANAYQKFFNHFDFTCNDPTSAALPDPDPSGAGKQPNTAHSAQDPASSEVTTQPQLPQPLNPSTPQPSQPATIHYITEPPHSLSNYWLNCILLPSKEDRDAFLKYTNENGVMTRPAWKLMSELEMFKDCETGSLENSMILIDSLVNVPSSAFFN